MALAATFTVTPNGLWSEKVSDFWFDCVLADLPPEGAAQLAAIEPGAAVEAV